MPTKKIKSLSRTESLVQSNERLVAENTDLLRRLEAQMVSCCDNERLVRQQQNALAKCIAEKERDNATISILVRRLDEAMKK